jgi:hypothetical protein
MLSDGAVSGGTIAEVWEDSMRLLLRQRGAAVIDTDTGGGTMEFEGLVLRVRNPAAEPRISDRYVDPQLIADYGGLFSRPRRGRPTEITTVADRLFAWPAANGRKLDQIRRIVTELKDNPNSRRAVAQIWHPERDLPAGAAQSPSGHCHLYFSVREEALNLTVSSRSVDAWNGELPNLLALVGLQQRVADRLQLPLGLFVHFVASYHLYIRDLPSALAAFPEEEP